MLENFGWTKTEISYKLDQYGFRESGAIDSENCFCVFGDSFTFGESIKREHIFADVISRKIGISYYNFGTRGGSDDSAVRLALTWLRKIKPKFVIWQQTFKQRFEMIEWDMYASVYGINTGGIGQSPASGDNLYKSWSTFEINQDLQKLKNTATMRLLCQSLSITLYEIGNNEFYFDEMDYAQDLMHPGKFCHQRVAEKFIELYQN